ncbi:TetR/AcrR family transcriptional regulator [Massilia pinisoli]|uniref:TetR/AcrR family transcriptional regulator n=1 Tax=Massilia pinisoli TaxID=1772194 RepID=A0ABT1ZTC1_9BURK|nr:TetR/AcrR family transcriptional regulator [Massilia pinisoli]MCS0583111.1 TetR/AcrR family transcriptional regulator [Massilia pinisoli]
MNTENPTQSYDVRSHILATGQRIMSGKGYSAVGLNEILTAAGVPKGSFYHYFGSKDAYGEAMLTRYFDDYLSELDHIFQQPGLTAAQRLMNYWASWQVSQSFDNCQGKCLAVKLGAEVADLSEAMRLVLRRGTAQIVGRLAEALAAGIADRSLTVDGDPDGVAESLYQLWVGASIMAKIERTTRPFGTALAATRQMLHLAR